MLKNYKKKLKKSFLNVWVRFSKHRKRNILIVVVLIIVGFIYRSVTKEPQGITSTQVVKKTMIESFSANGNVQAKSIADMKFNSPSKITWIGVKEGDKVRKYQAVAQLDTVSINAAYQQALSNYRNYQAISDQVLDGAKGHENDENFVLRAQRTTTEVNRDNSYDALLAAQNNLKNAVLISPISGTVVDTNGIVAGLNLSGADLENKFIRIVDLESLYFDARIDEIDFGKVKDNQEVVVNIDAYPADSCNGKVRFIGKEGKETSGGVVTMPVEVAITKCDLNLVVGLNGEANFVLSKIDNAMVIPKKYLIAKNNKNYVLVQNGKSIKNREQKEVMVGAESSVEAQITDGLNDGDTIVFIPGK